LFEFFLLAKTIFYLKKLPLIREVVPEGMLPEDPFTSFYEHEKDEKSKEEKQKVEDEQQKKFTKLYYLPRRG